MEMNATDIRRLNSDIMDIRYAFIAIANRKYLDTLDRCFEALDYIEALQDEANEERSARETAEECHDRAIDEINELEAKLKAAEKKLESMESAAYTADHHGYYTMVTELSELLGPK